MLAKTPINPHENTIISLTKESGGSITQWASFQPNLTGHVSYKGVPVTKLTIVSTIDSFWNPKVGGIGDVIFGIFDTPFLPLCKYTKRKRLYTLNVML